MASSDARRGFASEVLSDLARAIHVASEHKATSLTKLAELRPYVDKLRTAESRGLDAEFVEQAGFQELFALERGEPTKAICPICFDGVAANGATVATPCAHLFYRTCIEWLKRSGDCVPVKLSPLTP